MFLSLKLSIDLKISTLLFKSNSWPRYKRCDLFIAVIWYALKKSARGRNQFQTSNLVLILTP
ncbi:hypothetical protein B6A10_06715 [Flavobacterium sp. L1I52]|uniref:Uncharacterized protein n=1 Tax=Flavobacterium pokkalii TaxID=1940408 RepID=A0ABR7US85_9FLAO|nr:hypothetical protein [Flavobacterium pokkalii]